MTKKKETDENVVVAVENADDDNADMHYSLKNRTFFERHLSTTKQIHLPIVPDGVSRDLSSMYVLFLPLHQAM